MSKKSRDSAGREISGPEERAQLMGAVPSLAGSVGVRRACELLGVSRATWYRARRTRPAARPRPRPPLALRPHEQEEALGVLHSERFVDQAPRAVYATLLEEGRYLASVRTLHRLSWPRAASRGTGGRSGDIPTMSGRNCSQPPPSNSGRGTSPS